MAALFMDLLVALALIRYLILFKTMLLFEPVEGAGSTPLPSENNVEGQSSVLRRLVDWADTIEALPAGGSHSTTRRLHRSLRVASHGKQDALWNLLREEGKHHRVRRISSWFNIRRSIFDIRSG